MKLKITIIIALILLLTGSLFAEKKFTNFKLDDLKGKSVTLKKLLKDGPLVIDFWASWCAPCKKALPHLDELDKKYKDIRVVAISIDKPRKKMAAKAIVKKNKYKFLTLFDTDQSISKKMGVNAIPHTFIVNKDGMVVFDFNSGKPGAEKVLEAEIQKLLGIEAVIEEPIQAPTEEAPAE
ncbi:MAG: TlpA disulfide reductase family protein [Candidatus Zophobacter franzmannii]|nr:TlpA disulfide reductase family protein [Candidatus Zophobacter franzmannii]